MFISYAQNFEDVILWRALKHIDKGFYIDVGAQDPKVDSISLAFHERGWRGVHVEPLEEFAVALRRERPGDIVIEAAVGSAIGQVTLFGISGTGLSTTDQGTATRQTCAGRNVQEIRRTGVRLSDIFETYRDREIHWLKIDVEGAEKSVLASWGASPARPWVVVVEYVDPLTVEDVSGGWEADLCALGYEFVYADGLNKFYLSLAHLDLRKHFGAGPNVFDGFTLSGTQSASFSVHLNEIIRQIEAREAILSAKVAAQGENIAFLAAEGHAREVDHASHIAELTRTLEATKREHQACESQLVSSLAEQAAALEALHQEHATRERDLAANFVEQTRMLEVMRQEHSAREDDLAAKLADCQREIARLLPIIHKQNEWGSASIEHVGNLNAQLAAIKQSTSWRLTRPLRALKSSSAFVSVKIRRLPGAIVRRSAGLVRSTAPKLYQRIAVNRTARRFYSVVRPLTAAPQINPVSERLPVEPRSLPLMDCQPAESGASATLVTLIGSMRTWNLGKRING